MQYNIKKYNTNIAYSAETNTNWNYPKAIQIHQILRRFLKRSKLTTSMSSVPWFKIYKLGGITMCTNSLISLIIRKQQQDPSGMDRWTSITINGRCKDQVIINSAYRVYLTSVHNVRSNTAFYQ